MSGDNTACAENCADNADNDDDGDVDCDDSDCEGARVCNPVAEDCDDGADNDGDGDSDCDDSDCKDAENCKPVAVEVCNDKSDNDGDGKTDCDDTDCAAAANCVPETNCNDKVDNDEDGDVDCDDTDCAAAEACKPVAVEDCDDGKDNDNDGKIDCSDLQCANDAACKNGAACPAASQALECGKEITQDLALPAGTSDVINSYGVCSDLSYTGNEAAFTFASPGPGYTVTINSGNTDLHVFVIGAEGSCDVAECKAGGSSQKTFVTGPGDTKGNEFLVIVDGPNGKTGMFSITATCFQN